MSSKLKNYIILFLACTTAGIGFQLFRARQQLADARRTPTLEVKRSEIITSSAPAPALVDNTPAPPAPAPERAPAPAEIAPPEADRGGPGGNRGARFGAQMAELMKDPEFAAALKLDQEARIENRYGALFAQLNLPPEKLAALKSLLAERENANREVWATAAAQGMNPRDNRDELRQLTAEFQAEVDANIKATLGDSVVTALENYNTTAPQRSLVNDLNQKLAISSQPLNESQAQQLTLILAETGETNGRNVYVTDDTITRAKGILTPAQVSNLEKLQAEQQARQVIFEKTRAAREAAGGGGRPRDN